MSLPPRYIVVRKRLHLSKASEILFWEEFEERADAVARFFKEYGEGAEDTWPPDRIDEELGKGYGGLEFVSGYESVRLLYRF